MRKLLVIGVFVGVIYLLAAGYADVYLAPTGEDGMSKILTKLPEITIDNTNGVKGAKDTYDMWWYYNMGADTSHHYSWTGNYETELDTYMVWFQPPAACSLLGGYMWVRNLYDSLTTHTFVGFIAELNQTIPIGGNSYSYDVIFNRSYSPDWLDYKWNGNSPGFYVTAPLISSFIDTVHDTIAAGLDHIHSTSITLATPVDNGTDIYGVGWFRDQWPTDSMGPNCVFMVNSDGAPLPTHSIVHASKSGIVGWYRWYYSGYGVPLHIYSHIRLYENPPPKFEQIDALTNTYTTGPRDVYVQVSDFGLPPDQSGVDSVYLYWSLNSTGVWNAIGTNTIVSGDSTLGYYHFQIPGANVGDTVHYYFTAKDIQDASTTTNTYSYVIKSGTPGYALYIDGVGGDGGFATDALTRLYKVDRWDVSVDGPPDSSVFAYYTSSKGPGGNKVVWADWGGKNISMFTYGCDYQSYADSIYLKEFIDAGGYFWFMDQDMGYALLNDLFQDYGNHDVPAGSWVYTILGLHNFTDDDTLALSGKDTFKLNGDDLDPVVGRLFDGVSNQPAGELNAWPKGFGSSWVGHFDDVESDVTIDLYSESGYNVSVRRENIGAGSSGKAFLQIGYFSYLYDPTVTDSFVIDEVAADSFVIVYAEYMEILGVDRPNTPEVKVVKVGRPTPEVTSGMTMLDVFLPEKARVGLKVLDVSGRVVFVDSKTYGAGLQPITWDGSKVPAGTYFLSVSVNGEVKGNRKVVVVR